MKASTLFTLIPPLVVIIIAIILVIYKRKHRYQARRVHREPRFDNSTQRTLDDFQREQYEQSVTDDELIEDYEEIVEEVSDTDEPAPSLQQKPSQDASALKAEAYDLIVIGLRANADHPYAGYELLQALLSSGLRYGRMNIFHRHEEANGKGAILFSLASAVEPGTFDLPKMGAFSTPGLTLFMRISTLKQPLQTLELMLETAHQLIEDLGGELWDETRQPLTEDKIREWREHVSQFEQSQQTSDLFS